MVDSGGARRFGKPSEWKQITVRDRIQSFGCFQWLGGKPPQVPDFRGCSTALKDRVGFANEVNAREQQLFIGIYCLKISWPSRRERQCCSQLGSIVSGMWLFLRNSSPRASNVLCDGGSHGTRECARYHGRLSPIHQYIPALRYAICGTAARG